MTEKVVLDARVNSLSRVLDDLARVNADTRIGVKSAVVGFLVDAPDEEPDTCGGEGTEIVSYPSIARYVTSRYADFSIYAEAEEEASLYRQIRDAQHQLSGLLGDAEVTCTKALVVLAQLTGSELYDIDLAEGQEGKDVRDEIEMAARHLRNATAHLRCAVGDVPKA
jgi:hypothetical protein